MYATCANVHVTLRSDIAIAFSADSFEQVQTIQNVSYGVLKGGVPQSIELKENAAYSSVDTQLANNHPIPLNSNVAYGIASVNTEPPYDELHYYY